MLSSRNAFAFHRTFSTIYADLASRRLLGGTFPNPLPPAIKDLKVGVYCGFDPTAASLHIGNLLCINTLLRFHQFGFHCYALVGEATGAVGDPSGRSSTRNPISSDDLHHNALCISKSIDSIFQNYCQHFKCVNERFTVLNNSSWWNDLHVLDFVSTVGRPLRMGQLLSRTSVKTRLASPEGMNFSEFLYQSFQAFDFLHLFKQHNVKIQLGGSDQMGNIVTGYELIKKVTGDETFGITLPLLTTSDGHKLGKSHGNSLWLDSNLTSPYEFYQHFMRLTDINATEYIKYFSLMHPDELSLLIERHLENPSKRSLQATLGSELTMLVHGPSGLQRALRCTQALLDSDFLHLEDDVLKDLIKSVESSNLVSREKITMLELVKEGRVIEHEPSAVAAIKQGAISINGVRYFDPNEFLTDIIITHKRLSFIRFGKKKFFIIQWL